MARRRTIRNGRNRVGEQQITMLISYMESHTLFARGQVTKLGPQGHMKYQEMWKTLTNRLNIIGPASKNVASWQQYWTKMRLESKSKKARFLQALNRTGHDAPTFTLSEEDERISSIYGNYGTGLHIGREFGFASVTYIENSSDEDSLIDDSFDYNELLVIDPSNMVSLNLQKFENISARLNDVFTNLNECLRNELSNRQVTQRQKSTETQISCLIEFMERHSDLANGTAVNSVELWIVLTTLLNNTRGPEKNVKGWKKTWAGLVMAARQSMRFLLDGTKDTPMSQNYIKIIDIVGYREEFARSSCEESAGFPVGLSEYKSASSSLMMPGPSAGSSNRMMPEPSAGSSNRMMPGPSAGSSNSMRPGPSYGSSNRMMTESSAGSSNRMMPGSSAGSSNSMMPGPSSGSSNHGLKRPFSLGSDFYLPSQNLRQNEINAERSNERSSTSRPNFDYSRNYCTQQSSTEPRGKFSRLSAPSTSTSGMIHTAVTDNAIPSTSRSSRSIELIQILERKGQQLVDSLVNKLTTCFDKQNETLATGLKNMTDSINSKLPDIVAREVEIAMKDSATNKSVEQVEGNTEDMCTICQDLILNARILVCGHKFCYSCVNTWMQHSELCPMCRSSIQFQPNDAEEVHSSAAADTVEGNSEVVTEPVDGPELTWEDITGPDSDDED